MSWSSPLHDKRDTSHYPYIKYWIACVRFVFWALRPTLFFQLNLSLAADFGGANRSGLGATFATWHVLALTESSVTPAWEYWRQHPKELLVRILLHLLIFLWYMSLCLVSLFGVIFEWIMFLYLQKKTCFWGGKPWESFCPFFFPSVGSFERWSFDLTAPYLHRVHAY